MAHAKKMILQLWHDSEFANVAVSIDRELGSQETADQIAREFGILDSCQIKRMFVAWRGERHPLPKEENIPLNMNGHDIQHPFNKRIWTLLFAEPHMSPWSIHVEFEKSRYFREHE